MSSKEKDTKRSKSAKSTKKYKETSSSKSSGKPSGTALEFTKRRAAASSSRSAIDKMEAAVSEVQPPDILVDAGLVDEPAIAGDPVTKVEEDRLSPLDRLLAEPVLPDLPRENRARLQMQSPSRLYFYWSIKNNPFKTLSRAFGGKTGSYTLVARLINLSTGGEEFYRVEPEGNWWFGAESDSLYRAEIGFYAPNRPYFRIVYSNELRTPRSKPSRRRDYVPAFNISAHQFAEVLNASGYQRDAFEVAIAGDDSAEAESATMRAYAKIGGGAWDGLSGFDGEELRFVLLALASGYSLEEIREEISPRLYELLAGRREKLSAEEALAALEENFDVISEDIFEIEESTSAVFGASAVNFPRSSKRRAVPRTLLQKLPRFENISSSG